MARLIRMLLRYRNKMLAALLALFGAYMAASVLPSGAPQASRGGALRYPVEVLELDRAAARPELELSGRVEAGTTHTVVAHFDGRVDEVVVGGGQAVAAGSILLRLDRSEIQETIHESRLSLDSTRLAVEKLNSQERYQRERLGIEETMLERLIGVLESAKQLRARAVITVMDYEVHASAVDARRMQILELRRELDQLPLERRRLENDAEQLSAQIARLERDLANADVRAPFDAIVLELAVDAGARVAAGTSLLALAPRDSLRIEVPWPVGIGMREDISAYALIGAQVFPLHVAEIGARIEAGRSTPRAMLTADAELTRHLVLGSHLPVRLQLAPIHDAFVVPESSLHGGERVFRLDSSGAKLDAVRVRVEGSRYRADGQLEWIVSADELVDGDHVLVTRLATAGGGVAVAPVQIRKRVEPDDRYMNR